MQTVDVPRQADTAHDVGGSSWLRLAGRFLTAVLAMVAGMFVLGAALRVVLAVAHVGYPPGPAPVLLEMGVTMSLGYVAWLRARGQAWPACLRTGAVVAAPAVACLVLVFVGVLDIGTALVAVHVAPVAVVLVHIVVRREELNAPRRAGRGLGVRRWLRPTVWVLVLAVTAAAGPAAVMSTGAAAYDASRYAPPGPTAANALTTAVVPAHDPALPTAVVVVGTAGANVSDALVPYAVLRATGRFNVYVVAAQRRPVPLLGGLDVLPDLDFAQLAQRLAGVAPAITVVPELPPDAAADQEVVGWLRDTARSGLVLGVCTGARLLAAADLLHDRPATSHWYRLAELEEAHPDTRWQRGIRYVDDGDVITTGGLLSSVDGTLRAVERVAGTEVAAAAARSVGWTHYSSGRAAPLPDSRLAPTDAVLHLLNSGLRADGTRLGVELADGVDELQLAAAFAPYAEARVARTIAVSIRDGAVRSRHGLTFVPRTVLDPATTAQLDGLVVPGPRAGVEVTELVDRAGVAMTVRAGSTFAFDEALRDMALRTDAPTARWAAKLLEYPPADLVLSGQAWPWRPTLLALLLMLVGPALVLCGVIGFRARRAAGARTPRDP